jgi:sigma-B regulation protein RsbU (phosphoserine phosphatase)
VVEVGKPAPPLGTRLPTRYEEETVALAPGDLTLLYTDGLVEATDHRIECYGFERLERALARTARSGDAREVRSHLLEDVSHFKGEILQGDDLSLVVARYRASPG